MNKKYFMSLLTCMMVAFFSFGFASCSSDDDDPIGDGGDSRIVGTWYNVQYSYTTAWKFEKNGTCQYNEWGKNDTEDWSEADKGTWKVSGNKLTTHFSYGEGDYDDDTYVYTISEDGKTLTLSDGDYGMSGTYTKK